MEGEIVKAHEEIEVREFRPTPDETLRSSSEMARALLRVVESSPQLQVTISGRKYLRAEAWQLIAAFAGCTVSVESVEELPDRGGFVARAVVYDRHGKIISRAESECSRDEPSWKDRPSFALRSMAQTRAVAKALRLVFAFVPALAGFQPTPAEEMESDETPSSEEQRRTIWALWKRHELENDVLRRLMLSMYGLSKTTELTSKQADELIKILRQPTQTILEIIEGGRTDEASS